MSACSVQKPQKPEAKKILEKLYPELKETLDKLYQHRDELKSVRTSSDYSIGRYIGIDDAIRILEEEAEKEIKG